MMTAEELLKRGEIEACYTQLTADVRQHPADDRLRIFLAQLQLVRGQWDKALTQLQVAAELDAANLLLAQYYGLVVQCEHLRADIFAGKRTPLVFGEPPAWLGLLVQANEMVAQGEFTAAQILRERAFEEAPARGGTIDGRAFDWLADADARLGPVFEAIIEGKYYWIPLTTVQQIRIEEPGDLRDLVWIPAHFTWVNGGESAALIPTRYPGSETSTDGAIQLARKTEWRQEPGGLYLGLGQRMLAIGQDEVALLATRVVTFDHADVPASGSDSSYG